MPESDQAHSDLFEHLLNDFYKPKEKKDPKIMCSKIVITIKLSNQFIPCIYTP